MLKISKSSTILPACIPTLLNIRHYNNSQREEPVSYLYLVRWCTLSVRDFPGLSQNTATFKHTGHSLVRRMLSVLFINLPGRFFHTSAHITSPSTCCVLPWMTQTPPTSLNMSHTGTYCNHWVKKNKQTNTKKLVSATSDFNAARCWGGKKLPDDIPWLWKCWFLQRATNQKLHSVSSDQHSALTQQRLQRCDGSQVICLTIDCDTPKLKWWFPAWYYEERSHNKTDRCPGECWE